MESNLGRRLAAVDKKTRDRAVKSLTQWLKANKDISDLDLLKLWKALFYCYWLSDKPLVQQDLAEHIARIALSLPGLNGLRYIEAFWKIILAEWHGIDRLRLDKFYFLCRRINRYTFKLLEQHAWDSEYVDKYLHIMMDGPLNSQDSKLPNALRYHTIETFLEIVEDSLDDNIPCEIFTVLLTPFVIMMAESDNNLIFEKIKEEIFAKMMEIVDREMEEHGDDDCCCSDSDCDDTQDLDNTEMNGSVCTNDNTAHKHKDEKEQLDEEDPDNLHSPDTVLVASHEDTLAKSRRKMYNMVCEIKTRYNIQLIDGSEDEDEEKQESHGDTISAVEPLTNGNTRLLKKIILSDKQDNSDDDSNWVDVSDDNDICLPTEQSISIDQVSKHGNVDKAMTEASSKKARKRKQTHIASDDEAPSLICDLDLIQLNMIQPFIPKRQKKETKPACTQISAVKTPLVVSKIIDMQDLSPNTPSDMGSECSKKTVSWGLQNNTVKRFVNKTPVYPIVQPLLVTNPMKTALKRSPVPAPSENGISSNTYYNSRVPKSTKMKSKKFQSKSKQQKQHPNKPIGISNSKKNTNSQGKKHRRR